MKLYGRGMSLVLALTLLCSLTACQTMNAHKTTTGAVLGAATGAAVGAAVDKDKRGRGALIGAAAGATIGGGIGAYLGRQAKEFEKIEDLDVDATAAGAGEKEHLTLGLSNELLCAKNSATIQPAGTAKLAEIAAVLRDYPETHVMVKGYSSSDGADAYNLDLSKRRAEAVQTQLVASRVAASRITALGMGESDPVASNDTDAGRAQNRRVEIELFPAEDIR